jgi:hypothetical protein
MKTSPQPANSGVLPHAPECGHTPGPWSVGRSILREGGQYLEVAVHVGEGATRGNCIALVYQGGEGAISSRTEDVEANARLIASAPSLLASLKECVLQIEYLHERLQATGSGTAAIARAEAAIAKAEGR